MWSLALELAVREGLMNGHEAMVQQLLEHKTDINAKSDDGRTALLIAAKNKHKTIV